MPDNIENKKPFTLKQNIIIWFFIASGSFTLTTIYNEFRLLQKEMEHLYERFEYEKNRTDRRYDRAIEKVNNNEKRIERLEAPGSDRNKNK